ncbi:MAG TPA: diguanylate cyclase [Solirubrobacteraceae bacterium]|jgi:diguanylate cyclase (GGDEF)-like protein|nr:diguanylate cyclase [Solirubrobacteraceae bacterium]
MPSLAPTHHELSSDADADAVRRALDRARRAYYEEPADALAVAIRCYEIARSLSDPALCARARALQGAVSLHRGDLRSALDLVVDAERHAERCDDLVARVEVAALKGQVSFFTGSYADALSHAERSVQLSDQTGDDELRIYARRATCLVFGNVGVRDLQERVRGLLKLTIAVGNRWEETISRNDLACYYQETGDLEAAEREIQRALEVGATVTSPSSFAMGLVYSTRADIRLLGGRPAEALDDAERAIALLTANTEANPYVLGVTVRAEVQARMALGQFDDAQQSGEGALAWLGDSVPQIRSLILSTLATELRAAGRVEAAYDALARSAELEREAFRELSELQLSLERATLETSAARLESDELAAKNRELAQAHAELVLRTHQLEALQEQLRDQAERDWLTGLHNRRYLARELERPAQDRLAAPLTLAVLDLDHFKSINDGFGHAAGDQVLVRVAGLLLDILRETDIVVRSGGEEFLVLMPATDARAGRAGCERIRQAVEDEAWERIAPGLRVTASIGVASTHAPSDLEALVNLADQRLYDAKRAGRNCVFSTIRP